MQTLRVDIDKKEGRITIENDGECIPTIKHTKENMYIPEMVFGHLLTGSNFDDSVKKVCVVFFFFKEFYFYLFFKFLFLFFKFLFLFLFIFVFGFLFYFPFHFLLISFSFLFHF